MLLSSWSMELTLKDGFRLVCQSGSEQNPSDPFGSVTLTITGEGTVSVTNQHRGGKRSFAGTTTRRVIERVLDHLRTAGFPAVARHRIPPGSALRNLSIESGGQSEQAPPIGYHAVRTMPGYSEAFELLDSIVTIVSNHELEIIPSPDPSLATA